MTAAKPLRPRNDRAPLAMWRWLLGQDVDDGPIHQHVLGTAPDGTLVTMPIRRHLQFQRWYHGWRIGLAGMVNPQPPDLAAIWHEYGRIICERHERKRRPGKPKRWREYGKP